jgi:hypothetical protein
MISSNTPSKIILVLIIKSLFMKASFRGPLAVIQPIPSVIQTNLSIIS